MLLYLYCASAGFGLITISWAVQLCGIQVRGKSPVFRCCAIEIYVEWWISKFVCFLLVFACMLTFRVMGKPSLFGLCNANIFTGMPYASNCGKCKEFS